MGRVMLPFFTSPTIRNPHWRAQFLKGRRREFAAFGWDRSF